MAVAGGLALGACTCLRPREGATQSTGQVRRGVTRPAAAARQPGAEMNEVYGMSASEVISQDNLVSNYYPADCSDLHMSCHVSDSSINLKTARTM